MFYFLLLFDNMIIHVQFMKMMIRFEHGLVILQENENNHVVLDFTTSFQRYLSFTRVTYKLLL